jgi:hypothetical protein
VHVHMLPPEIIWKKNRTVYMYLKNSDFNDNS